MYATYLPKRLLISIKDPEYLEGLIVVINGISDNKRESADGLTADVFITDGGGCRHSRNAIKVLSDHIGKEDNDEMTIITVKVELEAWFLEDYAGKILIKGDSIQDVIIKYSESLK